jgi:hypothetical protein
VNKCCVNSFGCNSIKLNRSTTPTAYLSVSRYFRKFPALNKLYSNAFIMIKLISSHVFVPSLFSFFHLDCRIICDTLILFEYSNKIGKLFEYSNIIRIIFEYYRYNFFSKSIRIKTRISFEYSNNFFEYM